MVISQDLDELLELADRLCVINEGPAVGAHDDVASLGIDEIGLMMGGVAWRRQRAREASLPMLEWRAPPRTQAACNALAFSPVIAIGLTMLIGMIVFTAMGYDGFHAVRDIFLTPFLEPQRWPDLGVKAAPLVMIALGLAIGFPRQCLEHRRRGPIHHAAPIAGTGVALATYDMTGWWILPAMAARGRDRRHGLGRGSRPCCGSNSRSAKS